MIFEKRRTVEALRVLTYRDSSIKKNLFILTHHADASTDSFFLFLDSSCPFGKTKYLSRNRPIYAVLTKARRADKQTDRTTDGRTGPLIFYVGLPKIEMQTYTCEPKVNESYVAG